MHVFICTVRVYKCLQAAACLGLLLELFFRLHMVEKKGPFPPYTATDAVQCVFVALSL